MYGHTKSHMRRAYTVFGGIFHGQLLPPTCVGAVASATSLCFEAMAVYNSEEIVFKSAEDDSGLVSDEEDETSDCILAEDSSDDDELHATAQKKQRLVTPVSAIAVGKHFKSLPLKTKLLKSGDSILSKSLSKKQSTPTTKKAGAGASRKMLDMEAPLLSEGSFETKIKSGLGEISNMLGTVIERLDKTESKIECLQANTVSSHCHPQVEHLVQKAVEKYLL